MWAEDGAQLEVKLCGGRERMHLLEVLDNTEGRGRFSSTPRLDGEGLVVFLRALLEVYPALDLHVVLDNAPAHHATKARNSSSSSRVASSSSTCPPTRPASTPSRSSGPTCGAKSPTTRTMTRSRISKQIWSSSSTGLRCPTRRCGTCARYITIPPPARCRRFDFISRKHYGT